MHALLDRLFKEGTPLDRLFAFGRRFCWVVVFPIGIGWAYLVREGSNHLGFSPGFGEFLFYTHVVIAVLVTALHWGIAFVFESMPASLLDNYAFRFYERMLIPMGGSAAVYGVLATAQWLGAPVWVSWTGVAIVGVLTLIIWVLYLWDWYVEFSSSHNFAKSSFRLMPQVESDIEKYAPPPVGTPPPRTASTP